MTTWRRWVLIVLGVQTILLTILVVALWPLLQARIAEIRSYPSPQKAWLFTASYMAETKKAFPLYVSPDLTGEVACTFATPPLAVSRYPFTWTWYGWRALVWNRDAAEIQVDSESTSVPLKDGMPLKSCRGFVAKRYLHTK